MNFNLRDVDSQFAQIYANAMTRLLYPEVGAQVIDLTGGTSLSALPPKPCPCLRKLLDILVNAFSFDFAVALRRRPGTEELGRDGSWEDILVGNNPRNGTFIAWLEDCNGIQALSRELNKKLGDPRRGDTVALFDGRPPCFDDAIALTLALEDYTADSALASHFSLLLYGLGAMPTRPHQGDGLEPSLLQKLASSWSREVLGHRRNIAEKSRKLLEGGVQRNRMESMKRELNWSAEAICPMLTLQEMVLWAREGARGLRRDHDNFSKPILEFIEKGFPECENCQAPARGGCGSLKTDPIARTLVEWAWWDDAKPNHMGSIRREGEGAQDGGPDEQRNLEAARARFGRWEAQLADLRADALKRVAQCFERRNLLPKGLATFFFARSCEPIPESLGGPPRGPAGDMDAYNPAAYWTSKTPSDEALAEAVRRYAQAAHYLLADMPTDRNTIPALMWMVSEFCHRALKIPERIDLRAHLLQAARGEPALHSLKNYYRDHFLHALEVCFLGHFLLDMEVGDGVPLWSVVAMRMRHSHDRRGILRLWYLAALLHDIGYGIDILKSVDGLLGFFQNDDSLKTLCDDLKRGLGHLSESLVDDGFQKYGKDDKPGEDHGVIGARHLEQLLEKIAKDDPSIRVEDYKDSIRAIAWHNSRKHDVSFAEEPLAFLLILCDTIQEWNRPHLDFANAPLRIITRLVSQGFSEEDFTGPLSKVDINVEPVPGSGGRFRLQSDRKLQFTLEFSDDIQWNAGVFNLWLDASSNFQRLDFAGFPDDLDIEVEYITPPFQVPFSLGPVRQMHRLRDAARETHMGFLAKWFPDCVLDAATEKTTNGAITYWPEEPISNRLKHEHLVLHLRRLSQQKIITRDIGEFRERLKKWRHYNVDREFVGDYASPDFPS